MEENDVSIQEKEVINSVFLMNYLYYVKRKYQ